jgi:hypothetical protein
MEDVVCKERKELPRWKLDVTLEHSVNVSPLHLTQESRLG